MSDFNSAYTGQQIDAAISEATAAGAITARLSGNGEPTNETVARVGDLYTDISDDGKMYHCISASSGVYEWEIVGSGEGGTPDMSVDRITGGVRITVTDSRGTTQADLLDGVSPTATVTPTVDGAEVEITDRDGTTTATLSNGYHIGSVALTSGGTGSGQTATYTMYLNDDEDDPTAAGTFEVYNGTDGTGAGDMTKAVYDTNNSGAVDNAEALGGHAPSYYATETELEDKQDKPGVLTVLPSSGTALAENTIYTIPSSAPVGTYEFVPPATGWVHGTFHTGSSINITFAAGSKFCGEAPTFQASTEYEFDVNGGIWVFGEVTS